jgi:integral membrane protein
MQSALLKRLRLVGRLEAVSFLLLLGVAMPLKYLLDVPFATKVVGWGHGVLFMVYCVLVLQAAAEYRFKHTLTAGLVVAALLPFGPFFAEKRLDAIQ